MKKTALLILAEGFEEIEAATPIDILRRTEVDVIVAGLGGDIITGAHGLSIKTDIVFETCDIVPDAVILPGGMPGAENLAGSVKVKDLILRMNSDFEIIAAICASPALVLAPEGILNGKSATCYAGMETNFPSDVKFVNEAVVQDGHIITSRGPATAFDFGLKIAENLVGEAKAAAVAQQTLFTSGR